AHVFATVRQSSVTLAELVSRIIADGVSHFSKFRQIKAILRYHNGGQKLMRDRYELLRPEHSQYDDVRAAYEAVITHLHQAYRKGNAEDRTNIAAGVTAMQSIDAAAQRLAARGVGVPFVDIGKTILKRFGQ